MESVLDLGLEASRWLQITYPQLEGYFRFISQLGLEEFYLALLPFIYWCLDKRLGKQLAYVFLLSNAMNTFFKHALRGPRPFWLDGGLGLDVEESYGVPSGHTQLATTVYLFLALSLRNRWIWLVAAWMIVSMGLSRIYLGVHFVHDVVVGFLLALLILLAFYLWQRYFSSSFSKRILGQKLLTAFTVTAGIALLYTLVRFLIGEPDTSVAWASFVPGAELSGIEDMATAVGALLGMGLGIPLESSRVRFLVAGPFWKRLLRYLTGILVTVVIWAGLRAVFPSDPLWLALPLRILRYFLILFWVSHAAPVAFIRLGLAEAEPDPGISLKM